MVIIVRDDIFKGKMLNNKCHGNLAAFIAIVSPSKIEGHNAESSRAAGFLLHFITDDDYLFSFLMPLVLFRYISRFIF